MTSQQALHVLIARCEQTHATTVAQRVVVSHPAGPRGEWQYVVWADKQPVRA